MTELTNRISPSKYIVAGFALLIAAGTALLCLPACTADGSGAALSDAAFTAVSAVCVTGLTVKDTLTYWSPLGQAVILLLIQIGGMGVITVAVSVTALSRRSVSLRQRSIMQEAISIDSIGDSVSAAVSIIKMSLAIELAGALMLLPPMTGRYGKAGIWKAFFHSVSAFCNAGFDLAGADSGGSLCAFRGDLPVNAVIMLLIITGGIGFLTWDDLRKNGLKFRRYRLQTRVVLVMTLLFILIPAVLFFFLEFSAEPLPERILLSIFQAVTPRTAGFYTAGQSSISEAGRLVTVMLMLTGGAPGSTAGGMKITTLAVIGACASSVFRKKSSTELLGRRLPEETVRRAAALFLMYICAFSSAGIAISRIEGLPVLDCLFEAASAIGTVGLSTGITSGLGAFSRIMLMILMFAGRTGGLTLMFSALAGSERNLSKLPQENINVG